MVAETKINTTIVNSLSEIPRIARMVDDVGSDLGLSADVVYDIQLGLEEVLTNVITHGCADNQVHHISIRLTLEEDMLTAEIRDDGKRFNPLEAPGPDLSASLKDRRVGGLGIHFIRALMDEVEYTWVGNGNRLVLRRSTAR